MRLIYSTIYVQTTCLVQWLARLTAIQEVPGSIPGYTLDIFLEVQGLERGPPSLVRIIGQLLDMRSSEIRLSALLTTSPLYCLLAATASVGLGSSGLQRHGFILSMCNPNTKGIYLDILSKNSIYSANGDVVFQRRHTFNFFTPQEYVRS